MVLRRSKGGGQSVKAVLRKNMLPVRYLFAGQRLFFAGTGRPCRNRLPAGAGNACPGVPEGENCNLRACRKTQGEAQAKAEGKARGQRTGRRRMGRAFAPGLALFCIKVRETPGRRSRRPLWQRGKGPEKREKKAARKEKKRGKIRGKFIFKADLQVLSKL